MGESGEPDSFGEIASAIAVELTTGLDSSRQLLTDQLGAFLIAPSVKKGRLLGEAAIAHNFQFSDFVKQFITPEVVSGSSDQVNNLMVGLIRYEDASRVDAWNALVAKHVPQLPFKLSYMPGLSFQASPEEDPDAGAAKLCDYLANCNAQAVKSDLEAVLDLPVVTEKIARRQRHLEIGLEAGRILLTAAVVVLGQGLLNRKRQAR